MPARRGEKKGGTVKPKKRGKGAEVSSRSAGDGKKTDSASAVAVSVSLRASRLYLHQIHRIPVNQNNRQL